VKAQQHFYNDGYTKAENMVCYIIPLATALVSTVVWRVQRRGPAGWWLNLLLYGGAIFGVVDHLWNGELFLIGENTAVDLMLGATITAVIFGSWGITFGVAKIYPEWGHRMGFLRQEKKRLH
jgi:hypothetical protein